MMYQMNMSRVEDRGAQERHKRGRIKFKILVITFPALAFLFF